MFSRVEAGVLTYSLVPCPARCVGRIDYGCPERKSITSVEFFLFTTSRMGRFLAGLLLVMGWNKFAPDPSVRIEFCSIKERVCLELLMSLLIRWPVKVISNASRFKESPTRQMTPFFTPFNESINQSNNQSIDQLHNYLFIYLLNLFIFFFWGGG